ncbi:MAG: energy transducer TonB [Methylococcaceae bacterium]
MIQRLLPALLSGLLVSLTLFWLMQTMVLNNRPVLQKTADLNMVDFVRLKRETKLKTKDRQPEEMPEEQRPPPPAMEMTMPDLNAQDMPDMDIPNLDLPLQTDRFNAKFLAGVKMGRGKISTNLIPLVRVPPRYPIRAASRRIKGWVKIEFTIAEDGSVKEPKVVDAEPSNIFNDSALQAIIRWKFKPKIIDGEPFEQRAVQILEYKFKK